MESPLQGVRVLDFTTLLPGPLATMMLADLGADVLRVEAPGRPDLVRLQPPFDGGVSAAHGFLGRGKRSIALDLKRPGAAEVVKRLVRTCDVVVEQFRPGVMARLGLSHADLAAVNPRVITCSITGYGQTGPCRDRAGHDNNYLALSGVMSHSGRKDAGPVPQGVQVADVGGGSYGAVTAILAALLMRERTGVGQALDVAMLDGAVFWGGFAATKRLVGGVDPAPEAEMLNGGLHYDYYRTKDDRWMSVGSLEPQFFRRLADALGHPEWELPWAPTPETVAAIKEGLRAAFVERTLAEWTAVFAGVDACVEPVLTVSEMTAHPQVRARGLIVDVEKPGGGAQRQVACPLRFSGAATRAGKAGGPPGADTRAVLAELGYDAAAVEALRADGVFGDALD
jgi:crotonobetainyl-CoA:carnitine CoA-transferase CaiB-like acyl-CoA transferase